MKKGDEIIFVRDIVELPSADSPGRVIAESGEKGRYTRVSVWNHKMHEVQHADGRKFFAYDDEFKLLNL